MTIPQPSVGQDGYRCPSGARKRQAPGAQTTTQLAAKEARATALNQQVQAMQVHGPSILAALDSETSNKVPQQGGAPGDFSAELWLN